MTILLTGGRYFSPPSIYPESFGAVGNGIIDDSAAVATALSTSGVVIRSKPGSIYRIATSQVVTLPDNADVDLNLFIDLATGYGLQIGGTIAGSDLTPAESVSAGSNTWTMISSVSGLSVGQWVRPYSNRWFDASRTQTRIGELLRISGIGGTTGKTLAFETPFCDDYRSDRIAQFTISAAGSSYVAGDILRVPGGTPSVSATVSSVNTTTGVLGLASTPDLIVGQIAYLSVSGGSLPTGYSANTAYFVGAIVSSTVILYLSLTDALNGRRAVVPSTSGSGTISLYVPQALIVTIADGSGGISAMEFAGAPRSGPTYSALPTGTVSLVGGSGSGAQVALVSEVPFLMPLTMTKFGTLRFTLRGNYSGKVVGVELLKCVGTLMEYTSQGLTQTAAGLSDCAYSFMDATYVEDSYPGNSGYASYIADASRDCSVRMRGAQNVRHAFTTSNTSTNPGVVRRCTFAADALSYSAPAGSASAASYIFTVTAVNTGTGALTLTPTPGDGTEMDTGHSCFIASAGTMPSGLIPGLLYYVHVSGSDITLHLSYLDSLTGTSPIIPSTVGSGTITATAAPAGDILKTHAAAEGVVFNVGSIDASTGTAITIECASAYVQVGAIKRSETYGIVIGNHTSRLGSYAVQVSECSGSTRSGLTIFSAASPIGQLNACGNFSANGSQGVIVTPAAWCPVLQLSLDIVAINNAPVTGTAQIYVTNSSNVRLQGQYSVPTLAGIGVTINNFNAVLVSGVQGHHIAQASGKGIDLEADSSGLSANALVHGVSIRAPSANGLTGIYVSNNCQYVRIAQGNDLQDCTTPTHGGSGTGNANFYDGTSLQAPTGTASLPGLWFRSTDQGFYSAAAGEIDLSIGGVRTVGWTAARQDIYATSTIPQLVFQRLDNPGVVGAIWEVKGDAKNSSGTTVLFTDTTGRIVSNTAGAEEGRLTFSVMAAGVSTEILDIVSAGVTVTGSVTTGAPVSGTAGAWKLGVRKSGTVALDTTQYVDVEIGGVAYKLGLVT